MGSGSKSWFGVRITAWLLRTAYRRKCHKMVLPLLITGGSVMKAAEQRAVSLVYVAFPCSSTKWLRSESQFCLRFVITHRFFSRSRNKGTPYIREKEDDDRTGKMMVITLDIIPSFCSAFTYKGVIEIINLRNRKCMFLIRHLDSS